MISVGIDVSKGKSTVCILKPYGEVIASPFEVVHTESELKNLCQMIQRFDGEVRVVMEATGIYHLPVLLALQEQGLFVAVINPFEMKEYASRGLRRVKTDKKDSIIISNYGIDNWYRLENHRGRDDVYSELKLLGRQYCHYMELHVKALLELTHMLDYTMPGVKKEFRSWNESNGKDKLSDFVERYRHFDNITVMNKDEFIDDYIVWAAEKKYHQNQPKAAELYDLASDGIPTLSANTPSTKMLVLEAIRILREIDSTLFKIITRMKELTKSLPEYETVRSMGGVGDVLAPKLIAEIGDIRRFHNGKALIAFAGIDAPPYQSGQFTGTNRKISKRGLKVLRKIGYETMRVLKTHKAPEDDAVYRFILKKESEGKSKRQAKIAGLNKFLRIYYARVNEVYQRV